MGCHASIVTVRDDDNVDKSTKYVLNAVLHKPKCKHTANANTTAARRELALLEHVYIITKSTRRV